LRGASSGETVAGGYGSGANANQLWVPLSVAVDSYGGVLVCDSANNRVQIWALGATVGQTIAGNSSGAAGSGPNELLSIEIITYMLLITIIIEYKNSIFFNILFTKINFKRE
jgi:hypothetical protein